MVPQPRASGFTSHHCPSVPLALLDIIAQHSDNLLILCSHFSVRQPKSPFRICLNLSLTVNFEISDYLIVHPFQTDMPTDTCRSHTMSRPTRIHHRQQDCLLPSRSAPDCGSGPASSGTRGSPAAGARAVQPRAAANWEKAAYANLTALNAALSKYSAGGLGSPCV